MLSYSKIDKNVDIRAVEYLLEATAATLDSLVLMLMVEDVQSGDPFGEVS